MAPILSTAGGSDALKQRIQSSLLQDGLNLSDEDWHLICDEGYARPWVKSVPFERQGIVDRCLAFLRRLRKRDAALRGRLVPVQDAVPAEEGERYFGNRVERLHAERISRANAERAATLAEPFRNRFLGGGVLTSEQALALLGSRLARLLGVARFQTAGIPLVGHSVADTDQRPPHPKYGTGRVRLRVSRAGSRRRWVSFEAATYWATADMRLVSIPTGAPPFLNPKHVPVLPGSVLDELGKVSEMLARSFMWDEAMSAWFVLTGQYPNTRAMGASLRLSPDRSRAMISIDVMPFVAPTSVATTMAVMRPGRANGLGPARLPRRRRVLLMAFMSERGADHVTRQLCTEFNSKVGPGDRYKGWRNAARDYRKETALLSASPKPRRRVKGRKRRSAK